MTDGENGGIVVGPQFPRVQTVVGKEGAFYVGISQVLESLLPNSSIFFAPAIDESQVC